MDDGCIRRPRGALLGIFILALLSSTACSSGGEPRTINGCELKAGAACAGKNLTNASLMGTNLAGANLSGADLSRANLSMANLTHANLSRANLTGATLTGAKLVRSNLERADLTDANLAGANMQEADLLLSTRCRTAAADGTIDNTSCLKTAAVPPTRTSETPTAAPVTATTLHAGKTNPPSRTRPTQ